MVEADFQRQPCEKLDASVEYSATLATLTYALDDSTCAGQSSGGGNANRAVVAGAVAGALGGAVLIGGVAVALVVPSVMLIGLRQ